MIVDVQTLDDPRLDAYARLTDVQLRSRLEPERGVFIAESGNVIERALEAGMQPLSLLMEAKWLDTLQPVIARTEAEHPEVPVFVAPREELARLTGFELTRGALAAFKRPAPPSVADVVRDARLVAVLENITNHTNVGAIFRSAAALGVDAVLVTPECYDPLYRRAVRVSMGTVFQVPWTRIGEEADPRAGKGAWAKGGLPLLHELGFATAAMALSDGAHPHAAPRGLPERGRRQRRGLLGAAPVVTPIFPTSAKNEPVWQSRRGFGGISDAHTASNEGVSPGGVLQTYS